MMPALAWGFVGGIVSWFVSAFAAQPIHRFFQMRSEITQCILFYATVRAVGSERGDVTQGFTENDAALLKEAQSKLRDLAMQMQSFGATNCIASTLLRATGFDPMNAGRSLVGYSNSIAVYGDERAQHRKSVFTALRIKGL
jgi:hypothetical protein